MAVWHSVGIGNTLVLTSNLNLSGELVGRLTTTNDQYFSHGLIGDLGYHWSTLDCNGGGGWAGIFEFSVVTLKKKKIYKIIIKKKNRVGAIDKRPSNN